MWSVWNPAYTLVLASQSEARRRLLHAARLPFEMVAAEIDERVIEAEEPDRTPRELALSLASAKAIAVSRVRPDSLVVGADQTLSIGRTVFHKSKSKPEALQTLLRLSGRTHVLTSGFAIARNGAEVKAEADVAEMTMRALDEDALRLYLDMAEPEVLESVGAYHWEGLGVHLFEAVRGDHATILGLPMLKVLAALRALGALTL